MHLEVIINRSGGTVRSIGVEQLETDLRQVIDKSGMRARLQFVDGSDIESSIVKAVGPEDKVVVVGGGDGTVSTAVRLLSERDRTLGILPLGTMNLFARALQLPLDPKLALQGLAAGREFSSDLGEVNGRRFAHHVTLGIHPKLARLRERMEYGSRWGKMLAGARAWLRTIRNPPLSTYELKRGDRSRTVHASLILVSNNVLSEQIGQLPYPSRLHDGVLALYSSSSRDWKEVLQLSAAASFGQWESNPHLEMETASCFELAIGRRHYTVSIDGELERMSGPLKIRILPQALRVLIPARQ